MICVKLSQYPTRKNTVPDAKKKSLTTCFYPNSIRSILLSDLPVQWQDENLVETAVPPALIGIVGRGRGREKDDSQRLFLCLLDPNSLSSEVGRFAMRRTYGTLFVVFSTFLFWNLACPWLILGVRELPRRPVLPSFMLPFLCACQSVPSPSSALDHDEAVTRQLIAHMQHSHPRRI